ncbi:hypothetical protein [Streptomyces sp. NEAU-H3]|nr:hypothetical protein [Streptomyces sp. NEAU-H3]
MTGCVVDFDAVPDRLAHQTSTLASVSAYAVAFVPTGMARDT